MVRLNSAQGVIERVLVENRGHVLLVCRVEEFELARRQRRSPATIGFKPGDVLAMWLTEPGG